MNAGKYISVVVLLPVRFIGGPKRQGITRSIHGSWDPDRSVAVITAMGVPAEEALSDIGMNSRRAVIYLKCDGEEECIKSLE